MALDAFMEEIIERIKAIPLSKEAISRLKIELSKKHGLKRIPTDIEIIVNAKQEDLALLRSLQTKPVRSISGVAVVSLMTKPYNCPAQAQCTYCPGGLGSFLGDVPKSYTGHEPSTMRGIRNNYDAYLETMNRLEQYVVTSHSFDKIEIIVMGGTFTAFPVIYQKEFIMYAFKALNDFSDLFFAGETIDIVKFKEFFELPGLVGDSERTKKIQEKLLAIKGSSTLETEKKKNETAKVRCVGLTLETRSDCVPMPLANLMLDLGCTRVEIGIQSVYDEALLAIKRGNTVAQNIDGLKRLRDLGFKLNIHYMPGLPGVNKEKDLEGMKQLFSDPAYRPDMLKVYPCMVFKGTPLYQDYLDGKFTPLSTKEAAEMIAAFKPFVAPYCRIMRVQRDIPTKMRDAGVDKTNLRQYIEELKPTCRCIRCREVGIVQQKTGKTPKKINTIIREFEASDGKEYFISVEDVAQDILLGFVRMRFPSEQLRTEITNKTAIIRELHVYGSAVPIGTESDEVQHKGLGKRLLEKAQEIAFDQGKDKMLVISGVGVKEYYKKLGYADDGPYVSKKLIDV